jgi:hypothetical protein
MGNLNRWVTAGSRWVTEPVIVKTQAFCGGSRWSKINSKFYIERGDRYSLHDSCIANFEFTPDFFDHLDPGFRIKGLRGHGYLSLRDPPCTKASFWGGTERAKPSIRPRCYHCFKDAIATRRVALRGDVR